MPKQTTSERSAYLSFKSMAEDLLFFFWAVDTAAQAFRRLM